MLELVCEWSNIVDTADPPYTKGQVLRAVEWLRYSLTEYWFFKEGKQPPCDPV